MYFILVHETKEMIDLHSSGELTKLGLMSRVFANGPGDRGSIPGRNTKATKKVLDASLLNTQYYKVRIKGKMEQSSERSIALPYISVQ